MNAKKSTAKRETFPSIDDMSGDALSMVPHDFDFGKGYAETWEPHEASECEKCGAVLVGLAGDKHCNLDDDSKCDGYVSETSGPAMNYFYELPVGRSFDTHAAAQILVHLPLCVVEWLDDSEHNGYALALTGGGMNLAWEICEAFMRLGFLPPTHFADLPAMCGRGISAKDRWIAQGCIKSFEVAASRSASGAERVKAALAFGRKHEQKRKAEAKKSTTKGAA
jgi:hypothetical protein